MLCELGVQDGLAGRAVTPEAISLMSARHGGELIRLPLGEAAATAANAPYWVVHRADLQAALQAKVVDHPDIELRLGCQFEDIAAHAKGLTVVSRAGTTRREDLALALIGADGIWSSVRQHLFPHVQPQFSGLIAWRGTLEAGQLPREYASRRVQLWMGPNAHLVAYPIAGARRINVVAVVPGTWNRPGWSVPADGNELKLIFAAPAWPGPARMMIGAVDSWKKFALFTLPEGNEWTKGAIALLGDAAHAMLPFAAQGAGMAIEDAAGARQMRQRGGERRRRRHRGRAAALRAIAPRPRDAGPAHRAPQRRDLSPRRPDGAGARPRDQDDGRQPHAGAAGLDLPVADVKGAAWRGLAFRGPDGANGLARMLAYCHCRA